VATVTEQDRWLDADGRSVSLMDICRADQDDAGLMDEAIESAGYRRVYSDNIDGGRFPNFDGIGFWRWER
jgi:hypothetical protein